MLDPRHLGRDMTPIWMAILKSDKKGKTHLMRERAQFDRTAT
jgi:hypothetical protein